MAIRKLTEDLNIIAALDDEPNDVGGLTADEFKAKFDEAGNAIKEYINETLIPDIGMETDAKVMAAELASGNLPLGGATGQALMKNSGADYDAGWQTVTGASEAVPSTLMQRDENGRAKVADPVEDEDIANKGYVLGSISLAPLPRTNLINILRMKLQIALDTNDIDAWCDIMTSTATLDLVSSFGITISGGNKLVAASISQTSSGGQYIIGQYVYNYAVGQTLKTWGATDISSVALLLHKSGSPTDSLRVSIYRTNNGTPYAGFDTANRMATTTIAGSTLTTSQTQYTINFTNVHLDANTTYFLVIERTGAIDASNT